MSKTSTVDYPKSKHVNSSDVPKRVFILGAGFSRAISESMPLANELGKELYSKLNKNTKAPDWETAEFESWLSTLATEQPHLSKAENLRNKAKFEEASEIIINKIKEKQEEFELSIKDQGWLFEFLTLCHLYKSTIITFNYDTLLEKAINQHELINFDEPTKMGHVKWEEFPNFIQAHDCIGWNPRTYKINDYASTSTLTILKLHGSIDWHYITEGPSGTLYRMPSDKEIKLASDQSYKIKQEIMYGFKHYSIFVVPPTVLKQTYLNTSLTKDIWIKARNAIKEAKEIYILGYSLPLSDFIVTDMLIGSIKKDQKVIITDKNLDNVKRQASKLGLQVTDGKNRIDQLVKDLVTPQANKAIQKLKSYLKSIKEHDKFNTVYVAYGLDSGVYLFVKDPEIDNKTLYLKAAPIPMKNYNAVANTQNNALWLKLPDLYDLLSKNEIISIKIRACDIESTVIDFFSTPSQGDLSTVVLVPSLPLNRFHSIANNI